MGWTSTGADRTRNAFPVRVGFERVERETVRPTQFLYWFQVLYGVALGAAGLYLYRRITGPTDFGLPGVLAAGGLALFTLVFLVYLQNLHKRDLDPDYSETCYACKMKVNRYSEFCEHCGADLIERHRYGACPECQAEVFEGTAFCPGCGEDLRNRSLQSLG